MKANPELIVLDLSLETEEETHQFGALLAKHLSAPLVCYLKGDLGVGKTRLVRAMIQSLGYNGNVKSPTYTLVEPYQLQGINIYHFDLYRISDPEELDFFGIRDYFDHQSVSFIEWPDKGKGWLNAADLTILLEFNGDGRKLQLRGLTEKGVNLLIKLKQDL
ncbi:MAG: tRNA (adenosine(37)-N6)-threonylcarbamoyltransferase complex ATPase subunit type 1 TsaE [Gammaproteobacteria bacterium]|nr:tRNA (adenosine(37)-N6)-threonylcarbamoyltransferase complex ATPase subunit type 1 TsaE [Gammaproteobacteria bacterium]